MRLENTWQEIRDHCFIQNDSRPFRFPAPWPCFFSSVHLTHVLQGSGQRTGLAIAEAWFCAQWPIFVLVFEVCFWIFVRLEDPNMAHYNIYNRVSSLLIFYPVDILPIECQQYIYLILHMGYFLSLCSPNPSWVFAAKKLISFIWR